MTVRQIARRAGLTLDSCGHLLKTMKRSGLVLVLNSEARRSRVYWLTERGGRNRQKLNPQSELRQDYGLDWSLYGWVCFSHRSAVLRALDEPLQSAAIKRRSRFHDPSIAMSANNVRDVIKLFLEKGIVRTVYLRRKAHPRYELTELGRRLQELLRRAESPRWSCGRG